MAELRLILGDQLHAGHSWYRDKRPDVIYLLAELRQESQYVKHHIQKLLAFFAAMRRFAEALRSAGHRVEYVRIGDADSALSLPALIEHAMTQWQCGAFAYQLPDEWRLDQQLRELAERLRALGKQVSCHDSEHFYGQREAVQDFFAGKSYRMEYFYRHLRKRHAVLLTVSGEPLGGQWNYDADNRERWDGDPAVPVESWRQQDLRSLHQEIIAAGIPHFGESLAEAFPWPTTRRMAQADLRSFIHHRLPYFGRFQDTMVDGQPWLFHSRLSFALNAKLLSPQEVVNAAVAAHADEPDRYPLAAVEGFVRQILGWREYVRGVYWARMPGYRQSNVLMHQRPLPWWFWTGETKMRCLQQAITGSLQNAYAHHIQRLMVTGNFALLAGCDPDAVDDWYLGIYIDAIEWVELPNTRGMSQFADGGLLGSKPYVSGGAYLHRMGDHCAQCHYAVNQKTGDRSCPFNSLYWHFIDRHADRWLVNQRMRPIVRGWQKRSDADRAAVLAQAQQHLLAIETL
ncbi:cryptochrome/photolyase family protein [Permianibacter sp. IMCC34836]|uniref:cryptochrome/photolyase family protein n=1 Tax=Permianibacter fluminis TaxID=2738515 RepID=UPI0015518109|nr:cryptochrome/photolyase family protein [Permianibacter fluminis]NQD38521.1 cryptochrome/photolyase family protein [Permianibacter fluminis]